MVLEIGYRRPLCLGSNQTGYKNRKQSFIIIQITFSRRDTVERAVKRIFIVFSSWFPDTVELVLGLTHW